MEKLTGHGIPSAHLVGEVGQHYEDLDTGDLYECRIAEQYSPTHGWPVGGYVWEKRATGEDIQELFGSGGGSGGGSATPALYDIYKLTREQMIQFAKERANVHYCSGNEVYTGVRYVVDIESAYVPVDPCDPCSSVEEVEKYVLSAYAISSIFNIEITPYEYIEIVDAWGAAVVNA